MIDGATTIDELASSCLESRLAELEDAELAALAGELLEVWPRLEAARLRVLAAVGEREAYREDGARDAVSWLAWRGGERRSAARQELDLAWRVAEMPAVRAGLADGRLSLAKAAELGRAAGADAVEQSALVDAATSQTVEEVARAVDRWQLDHRTSAEEPQMSLRFSPTAAGTRVEAALDAEGAEWVQVAVDAAADKLGLRDLPWAERRAKGLVAICRHFLDHANVPTRRQGRPTVVVTIELDALRLGPVGRLGSTQAPSCEGMQLVGWPATPVSCGC